MGMKALSPCWSRGQNIPLSLEDFAKGRHTGEKRSSAYLYAIEKMDSGFRWNDGKFSSQIGLIVIEKEKS
jgi:hypothetical protein